MKIPNVGDTVKVWLPSETPWAECVAVHGDSTWDGRIVNRLASEWTEAEWKAHPQVGHAPQWKPPHHYKEGDVLRFGFSEDGDLWVVTP